MIFNSFEFLLFLPIVFLLYWFFCKNNTKYQKIVVLLYSYLFYAFWDYRFLYLLIFSTLLEDFTGLKMHESPTKRIKQFWFWLSISINLGFLGIFKYYDFFIDSFAELLSGFGLHTNFWSISVILPVGISFYTFHGLSYVIDIYYDKIKPEKDDIENGVYFEADCPPNNMYFAYMNPNIEYFFKNYSFFHFKAAFRKN